MKHFKLKVFILIGILVASLGSIWAMVYFPDNYIYLSSADIQTVERVLKRNGVTIEKDAIPKLIKSMPSSDAVGKFSTSSDVADVIFKNGYEKNGNVCYKDNVKVRLNPEIQIKANPPVFAEKFNHVNSKNAVKKITKLVADYSFDIADSVIETYDAQGGGLTVIVTQKYSDYPVFNNSLRFTVSDKGLSSISGLWFETGNARKQKHHPKSPVDVLLDFALDKNNEGQHIVSITQGYRLDTDSQKTENTQLIPTWRILTGNGEIFYSDF